MAKGSRYQLTGTEQPLGKGPEETPSSNARSGQFQLTGDTIPLSRNSIQSPSANPPSGPAQITGDVASLSRNPIKGWGSAASLTMSNRANKQSDTAAGKGGRGKKK